MVAVRMVSEGVDIPRLAVGVYATSVSTALFFAQAVGRFVRARRRGETASVFLPSIPVLLGFAAELEAERDHVLAGRDDDAEEQEFAEAQRQRDTPDTLDEPAFKRWRPRRTSTGCCTTAASSARRPRRTTSWACPGCWSPTRSRCCCASGRPTSSSSGPGRPRQARRRGRTRAAAGQVPAQVAPVTTRQALGALRKELNGLIGAWHHRTGQPHGMIHADLRRACGGPPLPEATADQIRARIDTMRRWASS